MSAGGRPRRVDLGEAVSFDSVLTILTVLLVLRVVFLVPMVNLDRAKTEQARKDNSWDQTAERSVHGTPEGDAYVSAFGLAKGKVRVTPDATEGHFWVEASLPDSSVVVLDHDRTGGTYVRLHAQGRSEVPTCQFGRVSWSAQERQWFTWADSVDYGDRAMAGPVLDRYRRWLAGTKP